MAALFFLFSFFFFVLFNFIYFFLLLFYCLLSNAASITQVNIDEQLSPADVTSNTYDIYAKLKIQFLDLHV